ncbi:MULTISPECIES: peptidoglycan-binding domain-containing protein [unclassified Frankia]|uniref:peptidoglycan-binding domain-containing protein n=1 Tax=unclassified Frankia TaxID=2632575 RepID=UPI002AD28560|nr:MULTISPECIES: peptidoglycan-binding domain-containing protein [unclassified Frankia]
MRMRTGLVIGAVAAALTLTVGALTVHLAQRPSSAVPAGSSPPAVTAEITRTTLMQTAFVDGTLSYGPTQPVDSRAPGTLTWLPNAGDTVERGRALLRADELPVVLLYGDLPMYRPLAPDTVGNDVNQFETNLRALGYTGFTVDQRYTAETAAAVKRWQRDLGRPETGTVDVAEVIYLPGPVRVASRMARLGAAATGQVLACTGTTKAVTAQVPAQNTAWAVKGTNVDIVLPAGAAMPGVVADVGTQASAQAGGDDANAPAGSGAQQATVTVTVTIANQDAVKGLDQAPVKVRHVLDQRENVLTVPVAALLAPIEGGYALEIVDGDLSRVVPVRTGLFADGRVEVSAAGIDAGVKVKVPA